MKAALESRSPVQVNGARSITVPVGIGEEQARRFAPPAKSAEPLAAVAKVIQAGR
jgi:hypothetical protein